MKPGKEKRSDLRGERVLIDLVTAGIKWSGGLLASSEARSDLMIPGFIALASANSTARGVGLASSIVPRGATVTLESRAVATQRGPSTAAGEKKSPWCICPETAF
jgi:hypothetical protein